MRKYFRDIEPEDMEGLLPEDGVSADGREGDDDVNDQ